MSGPIISNTGPLIALAVIGRLDILKALARTRQVSTSRTRGPETAFRGKYRELTCRISDTEKTGETR